MKDGLETESLTCTLEGVNCAGCIARIEARLNAEAGVILARGNASVKRIRMVWDPALQSADKLIEVINSTGYTAHPFQAGQSAGAKEPSLLPQLGVAAFGMMNIMAISFAVWAGLATDMGPGSIQFMHWISAALATPVVIYSGAVFYAPSLRALRHGAMTMDTPISLAIAITYAASLFEVLRGAPHVYFDAVTALIFFLLVGRIMERALKHRSSDAAENLRNMMQLRAKRQLPDGQFEETDASALLPGDHILVETGERVPADSVLLSDIIEVDESIITGETLPREARKGEAVVAGAVVFSGPARMQVTHVGEAAQIGKITRMIDDATAHKGPSQILADRFARGYIPIVLIGGLAGFVLWYFLLGASFADALMIAVAVLVVTCPCAAGLATPAVSARAVNQLMRAGVVVKSGDALERLGETTHVISDKTGTLSLPLPGLTKAGDTKAHHQAARLAAASRHPLAQALCAGLNVEPLENIQEITGQGMQGANGAKLGSARFVGLEEQTESGPTLWYRSETGEISKFAFDETPRAGTAEFLEQLQNMGLPVSLLSGDTEHCVKRFARQHHIEHWQAAAHPDAKLALLQNRAKEGQKILMFGDGINDAPALSAAHVAASFASATEVAQVAADVVLTRPAPELIPKAIGTARKARALIIQNLRFSAVYNIITVPLALAGYLSPIVAAILMSSSSIIVLANGLRLRGDP